ncbi:deferrochelatase/peroxidase EfeB [Arthrobacter stackebrandtii]|uniref:Deferrochelatase/peroxidase EfeB n=1 Tax=Arthrobacter stackebrandtii TaxID=272161 RepID=A0ABS4YSS9_9MICC|nr:Dyp-type peroxidase [Arthrobacter stackebrandtii]MBP2411545.1 deferrochelatase/peroxidase EfeB [Arthrobacter stackebrandtii]PYG99226.1 deferrochelatase/peroxidase EfeB [Arthrobacter stackebrandtii]
MNKDGNDTGTGTEGAGGSCPFPGAGGVGRRQFLRRSLLRGAVASGAAVAAGAALSGASAAQSGEAPAAVAGPAESYPFEGPNQAGIYRPAAPQAASCFAVFALTAQDAGELKQLMRTLTARIRFLTTGGVPAPAGSGRPPSDSEVLGPVVPPDGLTVTVGLAAGAFDGRFGLAGKKPEGLTEMRVFPADVPEAKWMGGELLLQVCANSQDTVHHALRDLTRHTRAWIQPQWQVNGFVSPPRPSGTPRNLFGYKDGTANPAEQDGLVWIGPGSGQPDWAVGGTFVVVRIIKMLVEFWDRVSLAEQDTMIGRRRDSGAPLDGTVEADVPRYSDDTMGAVTPLSAHIRLANPRTDETDGSRFLRRGYNYVLGADANGNQDVGLVFACYQANIQKQFETVQERLADEPMTDYIQAVGGQYFIALPGVAGAGGYLGQTLIEGA